MMPGRPLEIRNGTGKRSIRIISRSSTRDAPDGCLSSDRSNLQPKLPRRQRVARRQLPARDVERLVLPDCPATWEALRYPKIQDVNGGKVGGFDVWPMIVDSDTDVRDDAGTAYYWPVIDRPNRKGQRNGDAAALAERDGVFLQLRQGQRQVLSISTRMESRTELRECFDAAREAILWLDF